MIEYFAKLWEELGGYVGEFELLALSAWWVLLLAVVLQMLFNKLVAMTLRGQRLDREGDRSSEVYNLQLSGLLASGIVTLIVIALFCYLWATSYYEAYTYRFVHLLSLLVITTFAGWQWRRTSRMFRAETRRNLYNQPFSVAAERRRLNKAIAKFRKSKLWILLPALGFALLPLFFIPSSNLISIVLDTSTSMGFASSNGETPLLNGKMALVSNIEELAATNDFIITTFSDGVGQTSIPSIVKMSRQGGLLGQNTFFSGIEKENLIDYINSMEVSISFSPICETIWNNFLFTRQQAAADDYDNVISILVTDGSGEISDQENMQTFLCGNSEYNAFYEDPSLVNVINLSDDLGQPFINQALSCGYNIEDGFSSTTYLDSLERILGDFKTDWSFIIWMALIYAISALLSLFIKPNLR